MSRTRFALRSLTGFNFRLYCGGQLVSVLGTYAQQIGQAWLVLELSDNSGFAVGMVFALEFLPVLLFGAIAGVVADRMDKRRLIIATQLLMGLSASALAVVTLTDTVDLWMVYVLAGVGGLGRTFDSPARQAFVFEMVDPKDVVNAVGLNDALFNLAQIAGPAVGGVVIVTLGTGVSFAFNAVSFLVVIAALVFMRVDELRTPPPIPAARGQVREAVSQAWRHRKIRSNLGVMLAFGLVGGGIQVVLPVLAKVTFDGSAIVLSVMISATGVGALVGAVFAATRASPSPRLLLSATAAFGVSTSVMAFSPSVPTVVIMLVVSSAFMMALVSFSNSMLQLDAAAEMRGRLLAVRLVFTQGGRAIGSPAIGFLASAWGPRRAVLTIGVVMMFAASLYAIHALRPQQSERSNESASDPNTEVPSVRQVFR